MTWTRKKASGEYFKGSPNLRIRLLEMFGIIRQNHAMEHATIAILLGQLQRKVRLIGFATPTGFTIVGDIPTPELETAANAALIQLRKGQTELAVSAMCGTNLVVAGVAAGIASMIAGRGHSGWNKVSRMITASMVAALVAQPLGRMAQKHVTVDPDQQNVTRIRVNRRELGAFTLHQVRVFRS